MQTLEVEPQHKLAKKEVKNTKSQVGAESQVYVQNESTKVATEQPEAHDVVQ